MQHGFYDLLLTKALEKKCAELEGVQFSEESMGKEEFWHEFPSLVATEILNYLKLHDDHLQGKNIFSSLKNILGSYDFIEYLKQRIIPTSGKKLLSFLPSNAANNRAVMPDIPLAVSALLTGASRTPKLGEQIKKELLTCDSAEWMVSFIRMTGLVPLMPALEEFTHRHRNDASPCLKIATTTYMGVTEAKAIEWLQKLPSTEVRVSYDTKNTRLHAKTYIFHRKTGFGSAYVGSSNISKVAMDNGLEWNVKISQRELAHLWDATIAAFESHWEDARTFEPCCNKDGLERLNKALAFERKDSTISNNISFFDIRPFRYQEEALEDIERERNAGKNKHLIIAATGTGKTMISAFDYQRFCKNHPKATLLFLAHRKEILEQAQAAFRQITKNGSFGCIVDGFNAPTNYNHWFCTIQSWKNQKNQFENEHFQYVVIDEAHHGAASSYTDALNGLNPESLLGLTATPERADGEDIRPLFGGVYTHELRLGDAIERTLLSPFVYYGIADHTSINFKNITWNAGKYDGKQLDALLSDNETRAAWVLEQMNMRLDNILNRKCLGFCVNIKHAEFMADFCKAKGVPAIALTSKSSQEERNSAQGKLQNGEICIIFTVDMYNEGVDIPDVDTVIFLRPTESLTIFLQQLGRGLRRSPDKECLVVFDFIAQQHQKFSYAQRYRALCLNTSIKNIKLQVENGFSMLPVGCSINLEEQAQKHVLDNIKEHINSIKRKQMVAELRQHLSYGQRLRLTELMDFFGIDNPDNIYSQLLPSAIFEDNNNKYLQDYESCLQEGMRRLLLQTDGVLLSKFADSLTNTTKDNLPVLASIYNVLWGTKKPATDLNELHEYTQKNPNLILDIKELIEWINLHRSIFNGKTFNATDSLKLHASYTRAQVLLALGLGNFENPYPSREGVLHLKDRKLHVFFADINKSENDFSPTTMYDDYAISPNLFHWQSQSGTAPHSNIGQTYIKQEEKGYTVMLFIRNHKKTENGISAPYVFAGPATYVRHTGSKPMSIRWRLEHPLPAHIMAWASRAS